MLKLKKIEVDIRNQEELDELVAQGSQHSLILIDVGLCLEAKVQALMA